LLHFRACCRCLYTFFFLLIRRPPASPLFPYTTLFRSILAGGVAGIMAVVGGGMLLHRRLYDPRIRATSSFADTGILVLLMAQLVDRKSTRLNSSHVKISYAVFCLKKKSKNSRRRDTGR